MNLDLYDEVKILTSELGKDGAIGIIKAKWGGIIQVDFNGHLGNYTIDKHKIEKVRK
jgi:hypothetical protein